MGTDPSKYDDPVRTKVDKLHTHLQSERWCELDEGYDDRIKLLRNKIYEIHLGADNYTQMPGLIIDALFTPRYIRMVNWEKL